MDILLDNGLIQVETDPGKAWAGNVNQTRLLYSRKTEVLPDASQRRSEPLDWDRSPGLKAFVEGGLI